ncbi:MAG TPA: CopD family protein [Candidatus Binatia bacterium]
MVPLEAVVSAAAYMVLALFTGALATAGFVLPAGENPLRRALLASAQLLLLTFLLVAVFWLIVQGAKLQGGTFPSLDIISRYLLRTQSGKVWLLRELYGVFLLVVLLQFRNVAEIRRACLWAFFFALPLVAGRSLMSHAAAVKENTLLAVSADAVHLLVTALWAGGLAVLLWALWRGTKRLNLSLAWAAQTVARFSRLALFSVPVLILTGLYQSWVHVQSWNALVDSPYGRVLVLKVFLVLSMITLGAINFLSTRPRLFDATGDDPALRKKALRRIGAESLLGFLVLSVTGFLTVLPPAAHSRHQTGAHPATSLQPADGAELKILSPKEGEIFSGDQVPISFKLVRGKRAHHAHAYVDGELMGMFESQQGTLTGIPPGRHTLELRAVAEDHQTELDASDKVDFVVK